MAKRPAREEMAAGVDSILGSAAGRGEDDIIARAIARDRARSGRGAAPEEAPGMPETAAAAAAAAAVAPPTAESHITGNTVRRMTDRPADSPADLPTYLPTDTSADTPTDTPIDRSGEGPAGQARDRPTERPTEGPTGRTADRPVRPSGDRPADIVARIREMGDTRMVAVTHKLPLELSEYLDAYVRDRWKEKLKKQDLLTRAVQLLVYELETGKRLLDLDGGKGGR